MSKNGLSGNSTVLKRINRTRILNILWFISKCSRGTLAEKTGLDKKTITNICNSLEDDGLIAIKESTAFSRGRPPQFISLNSDAAYSIGIDVGGGHISSVLMDFSGNIRNSFRMEFLEELEGGIWSSVETAVKKLLEDFNGDASRINGIGICIPGLLDLQKGVVLRSVNLKEVEGLHIAELLKEKFDFPVFLEESSRSMAIAEIWFTDRHALSDFIVVDLGVGIGLGIVHDGILYRGAHGNSGELGHLVVQPGGAACSCGKYGCLETVSSGKAFEKAAEQILSDPDIKDSHTTGGELVALSAMGGNKEAIQFIHDAGTYIGIALANVVNILDPDEIILQGGLVEIGEPFIRALKESAALHSLPGEELTSRINVSRLGSMAGALGAAILPLKERFEMENIRFY